MADLSHHISEVRTTFCGTFRSRIPSTASTLHLSTTTAVLFSKCPPRRLLLIAARIGKQRFGQPLPTSTESYRGSWGYVATSGLPSILLDRSGVASSMALVDHITVECTMVTDSLIWDQDESACLGKTCSGTLLIRRE